LNAQVKMESKQLRVLDYEFSISGSPQDAYFNSLSSPWRDELLRAMAHILQRHDTVLDIGANIGIVSLAASRLCPAGHVYSFEPGQIAFSCLQANIEANGLQNVTSLNVAVGAEEGEIQFFESAEYGAGSFAMGASNDYDAKTALDGRLNPRRIAAWTVDGFVSRSGLSRVDCLKIDVEGAELAVLEGAAETLRHFKPRVLLEFNSANFILHEDLSPLNALKRVTSMFDEVYWLDRGSARLYPVRSPAEIIQCVNFNMRNGFADNIVATFQERSLRELREAALPDHEFGLPWQDEGVSYKETVPLKDYHWLRSRYEDLERDRDYWRSRVEE
jgi:FkbM family methyltransferase